MAKKALIAIGGNSLIRVGERGTIEEQFHNANETAKAVVKMLKKGWDVVLTHGNGPQAGAALIRSERGAGEVYTHTLDMCVATTQSEIGYVLERALRQQLFEFGINKDVITIPTMVVVDANDPAFNSPSKPIGPFYTKAIAEQKKKTLAWNIVEDASRGYRRVVPSPEPKKVLQLGIINKAIDMGLLVVALGGGGIPILDKGNGKIEGIEAVIDKDRSSALLASSLDVDLFIISTDADQVYINYKKENQQGLPETNTNELEQLALDGQFPKGSMGPKVESVVRYIKNGGKHAIITSYEYLDEALEGRAGTHIYN
ncbi:MAG TPA: carbamate kinase [Candidatus Kapabacteria bacterium]|nr:carbamate kinase [Candidatus Kapabacteria bacterium]